MPSTRAAESRSALVQLAVAVVVAVVLLAVVVLAARVASRQPGRVTGGSLYDSLRRTAVTYETYDHDTYGCDRVGRLPRTWDCVIPDTDSGVYGYRVIVRPGSSCWTARRTPGSTMPGTRPLAGCVHRRFPWL